MEYLLEEHRGYLEDTVKLQQYADAIAASVKPGDVVLDLGCGTGVLGLMALRAGASRVYAIDEKPVLEIARRTFAQAGFAERARCLRGSSFELDLPERVDVIVCDHVGYFGIDYGILAMLADARTRFLKPGGMVLPAELRLWLAMTSMEGATTAVGNWHHAVPPDYQWVSELATNTKLSTHLDANVLNGAPALLQTLNLTAPTEEFYSWSVTLQASRAGKLDALAGWFECRLAGDIWMTNSPLAADKLRRPQMLLAFESPLALQANDPIAATVMMRPAEHLLAWKVTTSQGKQFAQSTWKNPLLEVPLSQHEAGRVPVLNERGKARRLVLSYCDGQRTAAAIMQLMKQDHADLFRSDDALEHFVQHVLSRDAGA
ncbi:MAG: class I SAM-dependent methyltransferase [Pseudomonadota bacterium]